MTNSTGGNGTLACVHGSVWDGACACFSGFYESDCSASFAKLYPELWMMQVGLGGEWRGKGEERGGRGERESLERVNYCSQLNRNRNRKRRRKSFDAASVALSAALLVR